MAFRMHRLHATLPSLSEELAGDENRFDVFVLRRVTRQRPAVDADAVVVAPRITTGLVADAEENEILAAAALEPVVRAFGDEHALMLVHDHDLFRAVQMKRR